MGTSLTGLTPSTTYDALIKVGDNGPLSATAKYLSDGLGNDSPLALSTTLVGIGTTTPSNFLQVTDPNSAVGGAQLTLEGRATGYGAGVVFSSRVDNASGALVPMAKITGDGEDAWSSTASTQDAGMRFSTSTNGSLTEKMRITSAGNVGIGTSSPTTQLEVSSIAGPSLRLKKDTLSLLNDQTIGTLEFFTNDIDGPHIASFVRGVGADLFGNFGRFGALSFGVSQTANTDAVEVARFDPNGYFRLSATSPGIQFGGDTAAANALDDYEEGTFTATLTPSTSGTITLSPSTCSYTKIGRQVTVRGQIVVSAVSSPVGTITILGGLPFTSQNSVSSRGAGVFQYFPSIGSGSLLQNYQLQNSVEVNLILTASTIGAGAEFYVSLTYFV